MNLKFLWKKPKKKHHGKWGVYINPHFKNVKRTLFHALLWAFGCYKDEHPYRKMPEGFCYPNNKKAVDSKSPQVTWINHCTFLISIEGVNLLTDPIWNERCSPVNFMGPKRQHQTPLAFSDLPPIDYVLISHNHYDHLDKFSVLQLHKRFPEITWMVPKKVAKWFKRLKIHRVVELEWWDCYKVDREIGIQFHYVPSQHFSGRGLLDKNRSLWGGWVVEFSKNSNEKKRLYFVGDTGYNDVDFKNIGNHFNSMDLSLIPIGTYSPDQFMSPVHIGPRDAVNVHLDVSSQLSVATHWKTFKLSNEPLEQPPYDLFHELQIKDIEHHKFRVLEPGQTINW